MQNGRNGRLFWPILVAIVASDVVTKAVAVQTLVPEKVPHEVINDWLRFTLVYNPGAAFGLHVGDHSRWVFMALTIAALLILGRLYRTPEAYGKCHNCGKDIAFERLDALPHARYCIECKQREEDAKGK